MPTIVEVSDEDLQRLLGDGGLKPATLNRRNRFYQEVLVHFVCVVNNGCKRLEFWKVLGICISSLPNSSSRPMRGHWRTACIVKRGGKSSAMPSPGTDSKFCFWGGEMMNNKVFWEVIGKSFNIVQIL